MTRITQILFFRFKFIGKVILFFILVFISFSRIIAVFSNNNFSYYSEHKFMQHQPYLYLLNSETRNNYFSSTTTKQSLDAGLNSEEINVHPLFYNNGIFTDDFKDDFFYILLPLTYAGTSIYLDQWKHRNNIKSNPMRGPNAFIATTISFTLIGTFIGLGLGEEFASPYSRIKGKILGSLTGFIVGLTSGLIVYAIHQKELNRSRFIYYTGTAYVASIPILYYSFD